MRRLLFAALVFVSCSDPVREKRIADLGDEDPNVPVGIDHRPGQPCVLCHSDGGPASDKPFVVAGTIFATKDPRSPGAPNVFVRFIDSGGGAPNVEVQTAASGNFAVTPDEWPDMTFPLKVAIFDQDKKPLEAMQTTINREGSCNFCHDPLTNDTRTSIGAIFARPGGAP